MAAEVSSVSSGHPGACMPATLKMVSERSGVSIRTVNRALKGEPGVSAKTRQRILELARELRYHPNLAARNLKLQRKSCVGVLTPRQECEVGSRKLGDLIFSLSAAGWTPLIGELHAPREEISAMLLNWSSLTDHVVVCGGPVLFPREGARRGEAISEVPPEFLEIAAEMPMEFIFLDADTGGCFYEVRIDRAVGIADALDSLWRSGVRKVLRCGWFPNRDLSFRELEGRLPSGLRIETLRCSDRPEEIFAAGRAIVESGAEAVFFDTDRQALVFLNYAQLHGIRVPEELSVIGFDDDEAGRRFVPALSTVSQPIASLTGGVLAILRGGAPRIQTYPTRFIPRGSSRQ